MDTTYRFRFLLYLAAFMLVMSVCFVYAEPVPSQNHLLYQMTPQHAGFLAPSTQQPTFDQDALRTTLGPYISPMTLIQLEQAVHARHGFLHRSRHTAVRVVPTDSQSASSVLGLILGKPTYSSSVR